MGVGGFPGLGWGWLTLPAGMESNPNQVVGMFGCPRHLNAFDTTAFCADSSHLGGLRSFSENEKI